MPGASNEHVNLVAAIVGPVLFGGNDHCFEDDRVSRRSSATRDLHDEVVATSPVGHTLSRAVPLTVEDEYLALIDEHGLTQKDQTTHAMSS